MNFVFNPFTGTFDWIEPDLRVDSSPPVGQAEGYIDTVSDGSVNGIVWFFVNGHRYKLIGTLDDPVTGGGMPIGLLLALTYA